MIGKSFWGGSAAINLRDRGVLVCVWLGLLKRRNVVGGGFCKGIDGVWQEARIIMGSWGREPRAFIHAVIVRVRWLDQKRKGVPRYKLGGKNYNA